MQERSNEKQKSGSKSKETKSTNPMDLPQSMSDPGHTPGTAEGDRPKIEEALGERPSKA